MLKITLIIIFLNFSKNESISLFLKKTIALQNLQSTKKNKIIIIEPVCANILNYKFPKNKKSENKFFYSLFCKTTEESCCPQIQFQNIYKNFRDGVKKLSIFKINLNKIISYFKYLNDGFFKEAYIGNKKELLDKCGVNIMNLNNLSYHNILNLDIIREKIDDVFNDVIKYYSGFGCQLCENNVSKYFFKFDPNDNAGQRIYSKSENFENSKFIIDFHSRNLDFFFNIYENYMDIINYFANMAKLAEIGFCIKNNKSDYLQKIIDFNINDQINIMICKNLIMNGFDKKCISFFSQTFGYLDTFKGFSRYENSLIDIYKGLKFLNNDHKTNDLKKLLPIYFYGKKNNFDFYDIRIKLVDKKGWLQFNKGNKFIVEEILNNAKNAFKSKHSRIFEFENFISFSFLILLNFI